MDQLLKNKEFKSKMVSLSPGVKQWFIESLVDLFEQESEYVIDVLEDCRYELGRTAETYIGEAEHLRAASRMLEERRDDNGRSGNDRRRPSEALLSPLIAPSRLSLIDDDDSTTVDERRRQRRERSARRRILVADGGNLEERSPSVLSVPSFSGGASNADRLRTPSPGSARGTRSLSVTPHPPDVKAIEEETKAILQTMTDADAHVERERERQQERLERIRRQKKFLAQDRTAQAMKLLEKALEMDRVLAQDKARQGQMLQDKLQDLKKRRQNIQSTHSPVPDDAET